VIRPPPSIDAASRLPAGPSTSCPAARPTAPLLHVAPDDLRPLAGLGAGRRVALLAVHHVHVGDQVYTGGAEKHIRHALAALLASGAAVHVGYSGTSIYGDFPAYGGLQVEETSWIEDGLSGDARWSLSTMRNRVSWLRRTGADTVFAVQQAGGAAFFNSLLAARLLGLRTVASLRQMPEPLPPPARKRWLGMLPAPALWRRRLRWRVSLPALCCHAIILNSRLVAEEYARIYGLAPGRLHIIPNGERADLPGRVEPSHRPCRIAAVGRVTSAKGADTLLQAFAIAARAHPRIDLTYHGDGPLVPELRRRAAGLGLDGRVHFPGYQPDPGRIYADVDICVQPSWRESLSNSVIEAMARGIPCIVSHVGGLTEAVLHGKTGLVVPPGDVAALATAISSLAADPPARQRLGAAAQARQRSHFALGAVLRRTVEVILGLPSA
jgi:glycosyltransferase involved in cell wall biosynthesis